MGRFRKTSLIPRNRRQTPMISGNSNSHLPNRSLSAVIRSIGLCPTKSRPRREKRARCKMPLPRHCEPAKRVWQSVSPRIEDGFPRQRARWLGMTGGNCILQRAPFHILFSGVWLPQSNFLMKCCLMGGLLWSRRRVSSESPPQASGRLSVKREEVPLGYSTSAAE